MFGALRLWWPLILLAALPLMLIGCGGSADPNAATQFRPVDDDEQVAGKGDEEATSSSAKPPLAPDQIPTNPRPSQSEAAKNTTSPKTSGAGKSTKTPGKKSAAEPVDQDPGNDPALAGPTGAKVKRMRKLLGSLGGQIEGETQQAKIEHLLGLMQQAATTADEIIADSKAPPAAKDESLAVKYQIALMMTEGGLDKDAREMLSQAATDLTGAENVQLASLGRVQLFELHMEDVIKSQPADAADVLTALDTLLEAGVDVNLVVQRVLPLVSQLERIGYPKDGVAAIAKIGAHYADSKDPNEAMIGKQLQISGFLGALRSGEGDVAELGDKVVATAKDLVESTNNDPGAINLINQLANNQSGEYPEVSTRLYDLLEEKFAENKDPKIADKAKELVANGRKRLSLVGAPLSVTGEVVGGDPLDWSKYEGKVVLVHFWSVDNQPSLQDLADKVRLHRKYSRRGLNIIGVNLDMKVGDVEGFLDAQPQPLSWPTVTGENPSQRGFKHPAAQACAVTADSLPFTVLVGKDGKIAAAGLQGRTLDEAIVKVLAPADEQPPQDADDKPKDEKTEPEADAESKDAQGKPEEETK